MNNIIIPEEFMGVPVSEETMKEVLQGNVPKPTVAQPQPTVAQPQANTITPASNMSARLEQKAKGIELKVGEHYAGSPTLSESLRLIRYLGMPTDGTMSILFEPVKNNAYTVSYPITTKKFNFRGLCSDTRDNREYEFVVINVDPESIKLDILSGVCNPGCWIRGRD